MNKTGQASAKPFFFRATLFQMSKTANGERVSLN